MIYKELRNFDLWFKSSESWVNLGQHEELRFITASVLSIFHNMVKVRPSGNLILQWTYSNFPHKATKERLLGLTLMVLMFLLSPQSDCSDTSDSDSEMPDQTNLKTAKTRTNSQLLQDRSYKH